MRGLRTVASAVLVVLGALLIAAWAVSWLTIRAVEDGSAVAGIATRALDNPALTSRLSTQISDTVVGQAADRGVDLAEVGLEDPVRGLIDATVTSRAFKEAMVAQVEQAGEQVADELTDSLREPAPLILEFDPSDVVNDRIDGLSALGAIAPDLALESVPVQVLDAGTFEDVRGAYATIAFADRWFLWLGAVCIVLGLAVSHRRRWFLAKMFAAVAVMSLGVWAVLTLLEPGSIAAWVPGGRDGSVGRMITEIVTAEAIPTVADRMLWVAGGSLLVAGAAAAIGAALGPRR